MTTVITPLSKTGKYAGQYASIVDEIDADLAELNWTVLRCRGPIYAHRRIVRDKQRIEIHLHRVILERKLGRPLEKGECVDHINGNGLDNRRENLRLATRSQNMHNRKRQQNNRSGYKGVYWHKASKKWRAQIMVNGKNIHLGLFDTPKKAHEEYCKATKYYHGEFANFGSLNKAE